jgi:DUF4097 and DUF4098 domain-containing protein YvlB
MRSSILPVVAALCLIGSESSDTSSRFVRTYPALGATHLTIENTDGDINVTAWSRREIVVRATSVYPITAIDHADGPAISFAVTYPKMKPVDIEVFAPADTSLAVKSKMGKVSINGITGHLSVGAIEGDIHLVGIRSPSIDVNVFKGDIYFDGELSGQGPYTLQSMNGDIDVCIPAGVAFDLLARALTEKINIGGFSLSPRNEDPKSVRGRHGEGGPRLALTTYNGRILLHKK